MTPFYIRQFQIKGKKMIILDREMRKGCSCGILCKGLSSYSSPSILIPRKVTGIPCIATDLRHLVLRIVRINCSFSLDRDAIQILNHRSTVVLLHIKDETHTTVKNLVWV